MPCILLNNLNTVLSKWQKCAQARIIISSRFLDVHFNISQCLEQMMVNMCDILRPFI